MSKRQSMPAMHLSGGGDGGGGDEGGGDEGGEGGGKLRNALLMAIQQGKTLKKVDGEGESKKRRATIANPTGGDSSGGDLMSALKARMDLRRKGISGARKDDADGEGGGATGDFKPPPPKAWKSMPNLASGRDDSPISMAGMASALKAAASNMHESDDEENWDDD